MELERPPTSALIKLLREASRAKPRSIGFGRDREEGKAAPAMVLVAQVEGLDGAAASAAAEAGAAAVCFALDADAAATATGDVQALESVLRRCGDAVPGLAFGADAVFPADAPDRLALSGVDFLVAAVQRAPASLLTSESLAKVPIVDASQSAALLRAIGDMDVDALVVSPPRRRRNAPELTVYDLMHYKGVAELVRAPILVLAEQAIRPDDLQALRDVGVDGLVVPLVKYGDLAAATRELEAYHAAIGKLKIARRTDRVSEGNVFLPRVATSVTVPEGDDDEDDE